MNNKMKWLILVVLAFAPIMVVDLYTRIALVGNSDNAGKVENKK